MAAATGIGANQSPRKQSHPSLGDRRITSMTSGTTSAEAKLTPAPKAKSAIAAAHEAGCGIQRGSFTALYSIRGDSEALLSRLRCEAGSAWLVSKT